MEEDSFANLKALADHPSYGRIVRVLKFFPKLLSADSLVKEDYEACVKGIKFTSDSPERWGLDIDRERALSQDQLDAGFVSTPRFMSNKCKPGHLSTDYYITLWPRSRD